MAELTYTPVVAFARTVFTALRVRFDITGQEHVPASGGAVLAMNHVGYLDFALCGYAFRPRKRLVRFMAKKEVFDHKISGPLMRGMKHIPVDRTAGADSYRAAVDACRSGEIVGVFPEATISQSFELKDFKNGAARMAIEAGVPLLPMVLWGSQRIMTKGRPKDFRPGTHVRMVLGAPLHPQPGDDPTAVTAELKTAMTALLETARATYAGKPRSPEDTWWLPASMGGTAPTLAEAQAADAIVLAERAAQKAARAAGTSGDK